MTILHTSHQNNNMLGIMGGGQLGRMFTQAAQAMGYQVCVFEPLPSHQSPAASIANFHICANFHDEQALFDMANRCKAISTEFENIPAQSLDFLTQHNVFVAPNASAIAIAQNRVQEKLFFTNLGLEVVPFYIINSVDDIYKILQDAEQFNNNFLPAILKTNELGYDGKGQSSIYDAEHLHAAWLDMNKVQCVLEKRIHIHHEISVIMARDRHGNIARYPIGQNMHKNGILRRSIVPSPLTPANIMEKAYQQAQLIIESLNYIGVLCVEFFIAEDDTLYVNEIAPRPHNSGHYTQNACVTSQFEQQVRILADLPLGDVTQHTPVIMLNILGDSWYKNYTEEPIEPNWAQILGFQGTQLHLYGKLEARKARKMGHINCLAYTLKQAQQTADSIAELL
jgi:5-(carboxyamino)imidazole ribonucleotide synthase